MCNSRPATQAAKRSPQTAVALVRKPANKQPSRQPSIAWHRASPVVDGTPLNTLKNIPNV